MNKRDGRR